MAKIQLWGDGVEVGKQPHGVKENSDILKLSTRQKSKFRLKLPATKIFGQKMSDHSDDHGAPIYLAFSFEMWRRKIDEILLAEYMIDFDQAGADEEQLRHYWKTDPDPEEFVQWFAKKYDLTPMREWRWWPYPLKTFSR